MALGWVAFFGGLAQDMIQPLLPVFYTTVLGLRKEYVGLIEGTLATTVSLMKIGAGYVSDALHKRRAIVFAGYALSAVGRLALGFVGSGMAALGARTVDGVGKGLKDAPRDALVADSAGARSLGRAFGIQRTLDTLGSVAGPLIAVALLRMWAGHDNRYREVFLVAGVVAAIPLVIIALAVRERRTPVARQRLGTRSLGRPFAWFLAANLLFTLGNSSDAFIILRAQNIGMAVATIPIAYALFNLVSAAAAIPAGRMSDAFGRRRVILLAWMVYAMVYAGFALARPVWLVWVLYATYGLYYALAEGAAKALVAEVVPDELRGRAYGLYSAAIGVMALPASLIAGILWERVSPATPFLFGAAMAVAGMVGLAVVPTGSATRPQAVA